MAYIPKDGVIWQLDGLQPEPTPVARVEPGIAWLESVTPIIQARMAAQSAAGELRFTLLAVCDDKLQQAEHAVQAATAALDTASDSAEAAQALAQAQAALEQEREQRRTWHVANARRRHNYVPLAMELLSVMAERGTLQAQVRQAAADTAAAAAARASKAKQ